MAKVIVYHAGYGCQTGCCGHVIELRESGDDIPDPWNMHFAFNHPYNEDHRAYAERLVREQLGEEHVKDLDWENSFISED